MTPFRQKEAFEAEIAGLTRLLQTTPEDPMATSLMRSRLENVQRSLKELADHPPLTPEAELFFSDGPAFGTQGLEAKFTSDVLDSFQNMVTNHYSAKHYGALRRAGRRRGEAETKLFLTALPRGSFGLQLKQPTIADFVTASQVSSAMEEINSLLDASGESDEAFESLLTNFNPRVLKPLSRFLEALATAGGHCRIVTGLKQVVLTPTRIKLGFDRVSAAKTEEQNETFVGTFGGVLIHSWRFDFEPEHGEIISGTLAEEVTDEAAAAWGELTGKKAEAEMKVTVVNTRSGNKKPIYELTSLQPVENSDAK